MAPQVAERVRKMQETGQLRIVPGGVRSARERARGVEVMLEEGLSRFAAVVNCTGPTPDVTCTSHQLVRRLLDQGVAQVGPLHLGLDTDALGYLPGTDERISLVGPLRRGRQWEATAIPEIRQQSADLATSLVRAPDLVGV
jgi:uncharacterized NAD(P)/FAD-binding protein YdhS